MGLLNKILGKTPAEVQTQVVVPENPVTFEAAVKEGPRVGMWVRTDEGVGILTGEGEGCGVLRWNAVSWHSYGSEDNLQSILWIWWDGVQRLINNRPYGK